MKKRTTVMCLLLVTHLSFGQRKSLSYFSYKGKNLHEFLSSKIRYSRDIVDSCLMPFVYVKFKITRKNVIDSISFSNRKNTLVIREIEKELALTNGYWNIAQAKNRWFVIPVSFYFVSDEPKKGCDYKKIIEDQIDESRISNFDQNVIYLPQISVVANVVNALKY